LVDPPIIDFLTFDSELKCYVAEFVPDVHVSSERKESIYIAQASQVARRIGELLLDLQFVLKLPTPIVKLAHAGGGAFDLYTNQGTLYHLDQSPSPQTTFDVYAVIQVLSQEVQLEFITQRRGKSALAAG